MSVAISNSRAIRSVFIGHVFKLRGLAEILISNRDSSFTSRFREGICHELGMDLRFSTTFHSQTDAQSEATIRVLENFLRPNVEHNSHKEVSFLP